MSVKTTPAQHQSNLRNVYGTFAIEGMTINIPRITRAPKRAPSASFLSVLLIAFTKKPGNIAPKIAIKTTKT